MHKNTDNTHTHTTHNTIHTHNTLPTKLCTRTQTTHTHTLHITLYTHTIHSQQNCAQEHRQHTHILHMMHYTHTTHYTHTKIGQRAHTTHTHIYTLDITHNTPQMQQLCTRTQTTHIHTHYTHTNCAQEHTQHIQYTHNTNTKIVHKNTDNTYTHYTHKKWHNNLRTKTEYSSFLSRFKSQAPAKPMPTPTFTSECSMYASDPSWSSGPDPPIWISLASSSLGSWACFRVICHPSVGIRSPRLPSRVALALLSEDTGRDDREGEVEMSLLSSQAMRRGGWLNIWSWRNNG